MSTSISRINMSSVVMYACNKPHWRAIRNHSSKQGIVSRCSQTFRLLGNWDSLPLNDSIFVSPRVFLGPTKSHSLPPLSCPTVGPWPRGPVSPWGSAVRGSSVHLLKAPCSRPSAGRTRDALGSPTRAGASSRLFSSPLPPHPPFDPDPM